MLLPINPMDDEPGFPLITSEIEGGIPEINHHQLEGKRQVLQNKKNSEKIQIQL
jgi:hypothetical protein